MKILLAAALLACAVCPRVQAQDCQTTKRKACLDQAFSQCRTTDPTSECVSRRLEACVQSIKCDPPASPPPPSPTAPTPSPYMVQYAGSCSKYQNELSKEVLAAIVRTKKCFQYAYVRPDIAQKMMDTLTKGNGIVVRCEESGLRANWCAAGGLGQVILSPSKMLEPGAFCHDDIGKYFMHEVAHNAGLQIAPAHNEGVEDVNVADEVISLTQYCLRYTPNWLGRSKRTADVVQPERLECMRCYQEKTPTTQADPFWSRQIKMAFDVGRDPCPCPDPSGSGF